MRARRRAGGARILVLRRRMIGFAAGRALPGSHTHTMVATVKVAAHPPPAPFLLKRRPCSSEEMAAQLPRPPDVAIDGAKQCGGDFVRKFPTSFVAYASYCALLQGLIVYLHIDRSCSCTASLSTSWRGRSKV